MCYNLCYMGCIATCGPFFTAMGGVLTLPYSILYDYFFLGIMVTPRSLPP